LKPQINTDCHGLKSKPFVPIRYHGGKATMLKHILPRIPKHRLYLEPFGGSAVVLLNKHRSTVEVYNDLHGEVVNFFRQARENSKALMQALKLMPYSREEYFRQRDSSPTEPLQRAIRFFVAANQAFNGYAPHPKTGWRTNRQRNIARQFRRQIEGLSRLADRFAEVCIDSVDFERALDTYACDDAFVYCDPPYLGVEHRYELAFPEDEHGRLARALHRFPGKIMLSYFEDDRIRDLYHNWKIVVIRRNKSGGNQKHTRGGIAREMLIMNYDPEEST